MMAGVIGAAGILNEAGANSTMTKIERQLSTNNQHYAGFKAKITNVPYNTEESTPPLHDTPGHMSTPGDIFLLDGFSILEVR